jgi:hypothetical protein
MRPLVSIAAFALFLTVPLCAQRGGGHAGGFGGARGMSGAHTGGGHFSSGMRSGFSGSAHKSNSSANGFRGNRFSNCFGAFCGHPGLDSSSWGGGNYNVRRRGNQFSNCFGAFCGHPGLDSSSWGGGHHNVRRRGNRFSNCFGAFCGHDNFTSRWGRNRGGWGWGWGLGYYDPWLWSSWDYDDYRFDRDYYRERAIAEQWNEQQLTESRMQDEAEADRDEHQARRSYSRNAQQANDEQSTVASSPTVLIFRDRHQKEVTNYAIVGQNLLDLTPQHHEKIPLANLDLPATIKANDDRGASFRVPGSQEGQ